MTVESNPLIKNTNLGLEENTNIPNESPAENPALFAQLEELHTDLVKLAARPWDVLTRLSGYENHEKAAKILTSFARGVSDVIKTVEKRGKLPTNYKLPKVSITEYRVPSYAFPAEIERLPVTDQDTDLTYSVIGIPRKVVDELAGLDQDSTYATVITDSKTQADVLLRLGTPEQVAYAIGAEECAHSIFVRDRLNQDKRINKGEILNIENSSDEDSIEELAAYYSSDIEYHGLGWRIRTILDSVDEGKMTAEEASKQIAPFKDMILRAAKFRSKNEPG